jgi:hypothetical protein
MSDEIDPEVVADLKLRAYTERDRSRTGSANYDWSKPVIVTQWKCRTPPCKTFVDVTEDTIERWEIFNRELARRGEGPIASHTVLRCDQCEADTRAALAINLRKQVDRMADVIRQIKAGEKIIRYKSQSGDHAVDEKTALEALKRWGHPDVPGFIAALAERRATNSSKRERRGGF